MPRAIVLPMRIDDYGRVVTSTLPERVWADRVKTVLNTTAGERVMQPEWGSRIPYGVMESMQELPQLVEDSIRTAFIKFLTPLSLDRVLVIEEEDGEIMLEVVYSIPGGTRPQTVLTPYGGGREVNV